MCDERNVTTSHHFSRKSGKNTRFMPTITRHEIYHANTSNYLHSHTYLHNNTTLGAQEQIAWSFKHT